MSFRGINFFHKKQTYFIYDSYEYFQGDFYEKKYIQIIDTIFIELGKNIL